MRRVSFSGARAGGLPLALAAALALAAGACMSPSAKQSSAAGAAGQQAAKADPGSGSKSGAGGGKEAEQGKPRSWWQRITQSHPEPKEKPWVYGDVRPGKGLLSNDEDGFVLLRKGEGDSPDRRNKPEKVRR